ncbi:MAG: NAD(P)/FAD-dependent oxidoreductase [Clostridia bacterium]|nr:NAD(P)/FAD-dependent oxidoreductase [Clostridia bacterium]
MKKILIAGCGHGGLVAAARLAEAGYDVTVIEKQKKEDLGHDWEDRFSFPDFCAAACINRSDFPEGSYRDRGDCVFISPAKRKRIEISFPSGKRQYVMWRKPLIGLLLDKAENAGAKFMFETEVISPLCENTAVTGLATSDGEMRADLVIDSAGVFSPVRMNLPEQCGIEKQPKNGDLFYAWRAYFDKTDDANPEYPFEVSLYHEGERGLSWFCTNPGSCDILIGRVDKFDDAKLSELINGYRTEHSWCGEKILHGGQRAVIPVRAPLSLMVSDGYAAVGDAAFMTTPMNGMGIDLSVKAGRLLAETVIAAGEAPMTAEVLWAYNRDYHRKYGAETARNAGLKDALLAMPSEGVDFLFESGVIAASDLAGGGRNTDFKSLLNKLRNGMKNPKYFFAVLKGLIKGGAVSRKLANAPEKYEHEKIKQWAGI